MFFVFNSYIPLAKRFIRNFFTQPETIQKFLGIKRLVIVWRQGIINLLIKRLRICLNWSFSTFDIVCCLF